MAPSRPLAQSSRPTREPTRADHQTQPTDQTCRPTRRADRPDAADPPADARPPLPSTGTPRTLAPSGTDPAPYPAALIRTDPTARAHRPAPPRTAPRRPLPPIRAWPPPVASVPNSLAPGRTPSALATPARRRQRPAAPDTHPPTSPPARARSPTIRACLRLPALACARLRVPAPPVLSALTALPASPRCHRPQPAPHRAFPRPSAPTHRSAPAVHVRAAAAAHRWHRARITAHPHLTMWHGLAGLAAVVAGFGVRALEGRGVAGMSGCLGVAGAAGLVVPGGVGPVRWLCSGRAAAAAAAAGCWCGRRAAGGGWRRVGWWLAGLGAAGCRAWVLGWLVSGVSGGCWGCGVVVGVVRGSV
ncbi:hypothetical protein F4560_005645 [Saccharothrix ecbatanensis]|uniref:Uncharacterized protein n=1 Tax=Saccharothrix ecbatanensis TaxID=1105145 RepID=A0A7W9HP48_9PSEU|nr:hypothetical protein [Saccharothrix ecbatanensis]